MSNHLFPATQKPDFDTDYFYGLSEKRKYLDFQCYMFLCKVLDDLPERHYQEADELINNRDIAYDKAIKYLLSGEKKS